MVPDSPEEHFNSACSRGDVENIPETAVVEDLELIHLAAWGKAPDWDQVVDVREKERVEDEFPSV